MKQWLIMNFDLFDVTMYKGRFQKAIWNHHYLSYFNLSPLRLGVSLQSNKCQMLLLSLYVWLHFTYHMVVVNVNANKTMRCNSTQYIFFGYWDEQAQINSHSLVCCQDRPELGEGEWMCQSQREICSWSEDRLCLTEGSHYGASREQSWAPVVTSLWHRGSSEWPPAPNLPSLLSQHSKQVLSLQEEPI